MELGDVLADSAEDEVSCSPTLPAPRVQCCVAWTLPLASPSSVTPSCTGVSWLRGVVPARTRPCGYGLHVPHSSAGCCRRVCRKQAATAVLRLKPSFAKDRTLITPSAELTVWFHQTKQLVSPPLPVTDSMALPSQESPQNRPCCRGPTQSRPAPRSFRISCAFCCTV